MCQEGAVARRKLCQELVLHPSSFAGRRGSRGRGRVGAAGDAAGQCWVLPGVRLGFPGCRSPPAPVPCRAPSHTICAPPSSLQSSVPLGIHKCSPRPPAQGLVTVPPKPGTFPMTQITIKMKRRLLLHPHHHSTTPPPPPRLEPQTTHVGR